MNYIEEHNDSNYLRRHDQTLINYFFHDNFGLLHPKFHMWPFNDTNHLLKDFRFLKITYNKTDFIFGYYHAYIIHYPGLFKYKESLKNSNYYYRLYSEYLVKATNYKNNIKIFNYF